MTSQSQRVLNVLAPRQMYDFIMETAFLRDVLLGRLDRPVRMVLGEQGESLQAMDDVLIIDFENRLTPIIHSYLGAPFRNVGVFHMADETLSADCAHYAGADYVIRNYWRPEVMAIPAHSRCLGAIWVPNGYRTGIGPCRPDALLPFALRTTPLTFLGRTAPHLAERAHMLDVVRAGGLPVRLDTTAAFGGNLSPQSYRAVMENTRYALVPGGNSPETIRLYDALETGCVPVCLDAPHLAQALPGLPAVILKSWDELPAWWAAAAGDEAGGAQLQRQAIAWWQSFKDSHATAVADLINRSFARSD